MDPTVQIAVGVVAVFVFFGSEAVTWALRSSGLFKVPFRHVISIVGVLFCIALFSFSTAGDADSVWFKTAMVGLLLFWVVFFTSLFVSAPLALLAKSTVCKGDSRKREKRLVVLSVLCLLVHLLILASSPVVLVLWWWKEDFEVWTESRFATPMAVYMSVMIGAAGVFVLLCLTLAWFGWRANLRKALYQVVGALVLGVIPGLLLAVPLVFICPLIVPMTAPLHQWCGPLTVQLGLFEADAHMSYGGSGKFAPRMARALSCTYDRIDNKQYLINAIIRRDDPHYLSELFSLLSEHATPGADAVFRRYVADVRGVWLGTLGEEAHEHLRRWNERQNESTNSVERR